MIKVTDDSFSYILEIHIKDQEAKFVFTHVDRKKNGNNEFYRNKDIAMKNRLTDLVKEYEFYFLNPEAQPQEFEPM